MPYQEDSETHPVSASRPIVRLAPAPRLDVVALGSLFIDLAERNQRPMVILIRADDGSWYDFRTRLDADDALVGKLTTMAHECADYVNSSNGRKP